MRPRSSLSAFAPSTVGLAALVALGVLGVSSPVGAQQGTRETGAAAGSPSPRQLGEVDFPTSASPEAQAWFERGALLLHSFIYDDAADAFRRARSIELGFALAYWGEAMTHNHPLWRQQDSAAARAVLDSLAPTAAGRRARAPTEREKLYMDAVEALYGEGAKARRDTAYSRALEELVSDSRRTTRRRPSTPSPSSASARATATSRLTCAAEPSRSGSCTSIRSIPARCTMPSTPSTTPSTHPSGSRPPGGTGTWLRGRTTPAT